MRAAESSPEPTRQGPSLSRNAEALGGPGTSKCGRARPIVSGRGERAITDDDRQSQKESAELLTIHPDRMTPMNKPDLVALIPHRLCTTKRGKFPDADLRPSVSPAADWQKVGVRADFWGMGAASGGDSGERMYEIGGTMAAIGEQLGLACLTHYEVANWKALKPQTADRQVAREMSCRALIELQAHYVLAMGHSLANLAGRVVAMDANLRTDLLRELRTDFPPYSDNRKDWIQLSRIHSLQSSVFARSRRHGSAWELQSRISRTRQRGWHSRTRGVRTFTDGVRRLQACGGRRRAHSAQFYRVAPSHIRSAAVIYLGQTSPPILAADSWATTSDAMTEICKAMRQFEPAFQHPIERLTSLVWKP